MPDWTRRHVRDRIHDQVLYNDKDWRPLGPKPEITRSVDERREPSFDVAAFRKDYPDSLHTIPAISQGGAGPLPGQGALATTPAYGPARSRNGVDGKAAGTREANQAARAAGDTPAKESNGKPAPESENPLAKVMADDPVWKAIVAARQEKGLSGSPLPATPDDFTLLGTRGEADGAFP